MTRETVRCDDCSRSLDTGEAYVEKLIALRNVGEPPPMYAAKVTLCIRCDEREENWFPRRTVAGR